MPACSPASPCTPTRCRGWRRAVGCDAAYAEIERLAAQPRVRVVGETGLDYYRTGPEGVPAQQDSFRWHIDLAKRLDRTLQIHDRDSHDDVLRVLARGGRPGAHGDALLLRRPGDGPRVRRARLPPLVQRHGDLQERSKTLRDALAVTPLELLLVETDAPYLTPHPWRGATNARPWCRSPCGRWRRCWASPCPPCARR